MIIFYNFPLYNGNVYAIWQYTGAHLPLIADLSKLSNFVSHCVAIKNIFVTEVRKSHPLQLLSLQNFHSTLETSILQLKFPLWECIYISIRLTWVSIVYFTSSTCTTTNKKPWVLRTKQKRRIGASVDAKETWLWHGLNFTWFAYETEYGTVPNSRRTSDQGLETYAHKLISITRDTQAKCTASLIVFRRCDAESVATVVGSKVSSVCALFSLFPVAFSSLK